MLEVGYQRANLAALRRHEKEIRVVIRLLPMICARDKQHLRTIRCELAVFFGDAILRELDRIGPIGANAPQLHPVGIRGQSSGAPADDDALAACANPEREDVVWTSRSEEHTSELQSRLHLVCR